MKHTIKILTMLAAVVSLVACKPEEVTDVACERDIFYTVSESPAMSALSGNGNTVHLSTEAEWEMMLDRFCDYTQDGVQVMFCSTRKASQTQTKDRSSSSGTPTSITTSNRNELKAWMKEMERAGRTVNVRYDNGSGTWSGTAYVNLNQQDEQAEPQTYSGTFRFVPTPAVQEPPLGGTVWALEVGADTLIITVHGMMIWSSGTDAGALIIDGAEAVLEGIRGTYTDLYGETFFTIELNTEE